METHILFFILAGLLIAILIGYSIWSARRDKSSVFSNTFSTRPPATPINNELNTDIPDSLKTSTPQGFNPQTNSVAEQSSPETIQQEVADSVNKIHISIPGQSEPPVQQTQQPVFSQQQPVQENVYQEPSVTIQPEIEEIQAEPQSAQPNIITLYVVAPEGQQFHGSAVANNLDALGFHFGEYNIFHRHLDNTTASPVLFSVANMMQPGVFEIEKMDQFTTVGLVFFMHLPSAGNDLVNLRLMIRTVESFAQAMGGFVLDEQHQIFNDESRQAYLLRVKQG
ncbi:cell division protein ZipA [Pasteurellaceae bacterium 15-036681]|nr:cell division protein ZipA [Pasteurellaceae bacterium 15-036681]